MNFVLINIVFQLGMYTLSIMTEIAAEQYIPHAETFAFLFQNILNNVPDLSCDLAYYTILTMKHFVVIIGGHQQVKTKIIFYTLLSVLANDCTLKFFTYLTEHTSCESSYIFSYFKIHNKEKNFIH